ncbi:MAG: metal-dependent hydrolase [Thermoplasmata archaeon]|nr:metal-dependent hydrolase [Thermoplasmata archaeon]
MTDPVTHLLWGYVLARTLTSKPGYLFLGMLTGILLDIGVVLPLLAHHGWLHTPVFVLFVSLTLYGASRDRLLFLVPMAGLGSHLVLDSVGSGVMWLWPVSTASYAILPIESLAGLAAVNVFLLMIPLYSVWERWKATDESPTAALTWACSFLPRPVAWGGVSTLGLMMVFVMGERYVAMVVG